MVPQLHLHHIVRYKNDAAWPGPVWGAVAPLEYNDQDLANRLELVLGALSGQGFRVIDGTLER